MNDRMATQKRPSNGAGPAAPASGPDAAGRGADADVTALLRGSQPYAPVMERLQDRPGRWLITGAAGFIGSNLAEVLLRQGQEVVGLDDFSTGYRHNLRDVQDRVGPDAWRRFRLLEGDVADEEVVRDAVRGCDLVLHHAAFVSVPASVRDPVAAHRTNATGFLNVLNAARESGVQRVVYAATSASYGDDDAPVKQEDRLGRPLSMYAATKTANELYASVFAETYGLRSVGLRYFNIFGPRQDPNGAYAAVIPKWVASLARGERCVIFGDGETTRDFCHVANVVGANLLGATTDDPEATDRVYNIGTGGSTTLNDLFVAIRDAMARVMPDRDELRSARPEYGPFREGDVRHSRADVGRARSVLGFRPVVGVEDGIDHTIRRFLRDAQSVA